MSHTPTPWVLGHNGRPLSENFGHPCIGAEGRELAIVVAPVEDDETDDNMALIVRAVNAHEELLGALSDALATLKELADEAGDVPEWNRGGFAYLAYRRIDKVLAKAKA